MVGEFTQNYQVEMAKDSLLYKRATWVFTESSHHWLRVFHHLPHQLQRPGDQEPMMAALHCLFWEDVWKKSLFAALFLFLEGVPEMN